MILAMPRVLVLLGRWSPHDDNSSMAAIAMSNPNIFSLFIIG
jgi:hypothetical protein